MKPASFRSFVLATLVAAFACGGTTAEAASTSGFRMRLELTLNTALAETEITTGVPALVRLSESTISGFDYDDFSLAKGGDMMFTDAAGNELPFEVDTWNPSGESLVWVRIPSTAANTVIKMYYGNGATPSAASSSVWSDYVGVWHLNDTNATGTAHSYGEYPNSTATAGIDGNLADKSFANEEGKFGKSFRVNDGGYKTGNYNYGGVWVPGTDALKLGSTFTISGWFRHRDQKFHYDHIFYKRQKSGNGGSPTGAFAIEIGGSGNTNYRPMVRGNSSGGPTIGLSGTHTDWNYITFVFNGTTATVYENGCKKGSGTIAAVTDNTAPLMFGNNTDVASGNTGDAAWGGWIDECRLVDAVMDANAIAAEYAAQNGGASDIFTYGTATAQDASSIVWAGTPTVTWDSDASTWRVSATASKGAGTVSVVVEDLASGTETTPISGVSFTDGGSLDAAPFALPGSGTYSVTVKGVTGTGTETTATCAYNVYGGTVSATRVSDADEATLTPGAIRISIDAVASGDVTVPIVVSGTAVPDESYEALPASVTVASGTSSVDVPITPIYNAEVTEDVTVIVTVGTSGGVIGGATATAKIVNASVDITRQYVAMTGNDDNDGYTAVSPKATLAAAIAALDATLGGTVWIATGTYTQTATLSIAVPVTLRSISGNPEDVTITRNSTVMTVVTLNNAQARLLDLTVTKGGGKAKLYGGNVCIDTNGGIVEHCVLSAGDVSSTYGSCGGNIAMKAGVVTRCVIKGGYANYQGGGGGVWLSGGRIESCLVTGNYAGSEQASTPSGDAGGGIRLTGTDAVAVNCTVVRNRGNSGTGIVVDKGRAVNCVVMDNVAISGTTWDWSNVGKGTGFASCMTDARKAQPSDTCFGAPYGFVNLANDDYRLTAASSAVDAGETVELYSNLDLDGNPRVSGSSIDVGCYEVVQSAPSVGVAASDDEVLVGEEVTFTARAVGGAVTGSYTWNFGDGSEAVVTTEPTATHAFAAGAANTVSVAVTVGGTEVAGTIPVVSCPSNLYVNASNTAGAAYPYATPETAATTINEALAAATDGSTILVADGTYPVTTALVLDKGVAIQGASGIATNVIVQTTKSIRLFLLADENAALSGLTISGGHAVQSDGANVKISAFGGSLSNCVLSAGFSDNYSGTAGNLSMATGHVTHCVMTGGKINNTGGNTKVANVYVSGGLLENSLITEGIDASGGTSANVVAGVTIEGGVMRNCTIAKNNGLTTGGVRATKTALVENCVIAGNTSSNLGGDNVAWTGDASLFSYCVLDTSAAINDTCLAAQADSLFVDLANGDLHLAAGAVAIDAGTTVENPPALDLDGNPRVQGKGIDMGCYEYNSASIAVAFSASASEGILPVTVSFEATVSGVESTDNITYGWDFNGDGTVDEVTQSATIEHQFATAGVYTIGLYVTDVTTGLNASIVKKDSLHVVPGTLYVDAACTTSVLPYATRETAATNLQDAVDEAINGCTIYVAAGTYVHKSVLDVSKNVRVIGETGKPEDVIFLSLSCGGLHVSGAFVSNLTVTNGYSSAGTNAGLEFGAMGGMVSNCVVSTCKASSYSGSGSGIYSVLSDDSFVTHCIVDGCTIESACGGGTKEVVYMQKGRIENSLIRNCRGIKNEEGVHAGVVYLGKTAKMVNCTVVSNVAASACCLRGDVGAVITNSVFAGNVYPAASETDKTHTGFGVLFTVVSGSTVTSDAWDGVFSHSALETGCFAEAPNETTVLGEPTAFFADWSNLKLTPAANGPLYNKGAKLANAPATDLAGNPRLVGKSIDIGCYESSAGGLILIIR